MSDDHGIIGTVAETEIEVAAGIVVGIEIDPAEPEETGIGTIEAALGPEIGETVKEIVVEMVTEIAAVKRIEATEPSLDVDLEIGAEAIANNNCMDSLANLYMEPNQVRDERKSSALSKKIADLGCIDQQTMQIIVQRIETPNTQKQGGPSPVCNPLLVQRLHGKRDPELQRQVVGMLNSANNDINFSNFDKCYKQLCDTIHLLEQSG